MGWLWWMCAHAAQPQWVVESPQIRFVAENEAAERAAHTLAPDAERMWLEMGTALGWFPTRPVTVVLGEEQSCHGVCEGAIRLRVPEGVALGPPLERQLAHALGHWMGQAYARRHSRIPTPSVAAHGTGSRGQVGVWLPLNPRLDPFVEEAAAHWLAEEAGWQWWSLREQWLVYGACQGDSAGLDEAALAPAAMQWARTVRGDVDVREAMRRGLEERAPWRPRPRLFDVHPTEWPERVCPWTRSILRDLPEAGPDVGGVNGGAEVRWWTPRDEPTSAIEGMAGSGWVQATSQPNAEGHQVALVERDARFALWARGTADGQWLRLPMRSTDVADLRVGSEAVHVLGRVDGQPVWERVALNDTQPLQVASAVATAEAALDPEGVYRPHSGLRVATFAPVFRMDSDRGEPFQPRVGLQASAVDWLDRIRWSGQGWLGTDLGLWSVLEGRVLPGVYAGIWGRTESDLRVLGTAGSYQEIRDNWSGYGARLGVDRAHGRFEVVVGRDFWASRDSESALVPTLEGERLQPEVQWWLVDGGRAAVHGALSGTVGHHRDTRQSSATLGQQTGPGGWTQGGVETGARLGGVAGPHLGVVGRMAVQTADLPSELMLRAGGDAPDAIRLAVGDRGWSLPGFAWGTVRGQEMAQGVARLVGPGWTVGGPAGAERAVEVRLAARGDLLWVDRQPLSSVAGALCVDTPWAGARWGYLLRVAYGLGSPPEVDDLRLPESPAGGLRVVLGLGTGPGRCNGL